MNCHSQFVFAVGQDNSPESVYLDMTKPDPNDPNQVLHPQNCYGKTLVVAPHFTDIEAKGGQPNIDGTCLLHITGPGQEEPGVPGQFIGTQFTNGTGLNSLDGVVMEDLFLPAGLYTVQPKEDRLAFSIHTLSQ
jgi:hypothetical protein